MSTVAFLKRFWQRCYGRRLGEVSLAATKAQMAIVEDGEDFTPVLITDHGGARKVWREVKS